MKTNLLNQCIISVGISTVYVSFSCMVEVQYSKTIGGWLEDKEKFNINLFKSG